MSRLNLNQAYLDQLRKRYAKASKKRRSVILDEFVATSRYHRKHTIALLRGHRGWRSAAKTRRFSTRAAACPST